MSPRLLYLLTTIHTDMKAFPRAYTSQTAIEYFRRYGYDMSRWNVPTTLNP